MLPRLGISSISIHTVALRCTVFLFLLGIKDAQTLATCLRSFDALKDETECDIPSTVHNEVFEDVRFKLGQQSPAYQACMAKLFARLRIKQYHDLTNQGIFDM